MYPTLLSFLYFSLSKQQSTHQCYILAVHPVTESVPVRGDCRGLAKKNQGRQRTSDFSRCDYRAAKMKHTVVYESARTGDYLIVAIEESQCVPLQGRHDCRLTTACTNETHSNEWVRAHGRLSPPYLCVKPPSSRPFPRGSVILTQRICFRYGVQ